MPGEKTEVMRAIISLREREGLSPFDPHQFIVSGAVLIDNLGRSLIMNKEISREKKYKITIGNWPVSAGITGIEEITIDTGGVI